MDLHLQPRDPLWDLLPEKPLHMLPLSIHGSGSRYGTGMGYAFTYAIGLKTKASLVCKWKRNWLWIHRPWIFYRWLRNRFFNDLCFNPGRQRRSKSRGYGLTMNSSSTDLNYCGFTSVPRTSIRCSSRFSSRSSCSFISCTYSNWLAEERGYLSNCLCRWWNWISIQQWWVRTWAKGSVVLWFNGWGC